MSKKFADEAIVLKTYNVGEADRFCILLTRKYGRIAARAAGARRLKSARGPALVPLSKIAVEYSASRTGGFTITRASCMESHAECATCMHRFSCAEQGMELLMKLIHEGEAVEEAYDLACRFLLACSGNHSRALLPLFTLKLLAILGHVPSAEDTAAVPMDISAWEHCSAETRALLRDLPAALLETADAHAAGVSLELERLAYSLLGNQLGGSSLKSVSVGSRLSPAATPISV